MAIVPLLLIRTKVMMAIRMRGIFLPQSVNAKTSLGLGHGSVVDIRTAMYEIKKQLKMKVSLTRNIHIIALPQGTFLNARWSEDQSATTPCKPAGSGRDSAELAITGCVIFLDPLYSSTRFRTMRSPVGATGLGLERQTLVRGSPFPHLVGPQIATVSGVQLF